MNRKKCYLITIILFTLISLSFYSSITTSPLSEKNQDSILDCKIQLENSDIYVSPLGNDSGAGTEEDPFLTIQKAQEKVRSLTDTMISDINVYLRGGRYEISDTLNFNQTDGGNNEYSVVYKNYPGEIPVIDGGVQINGWTHHEGKIWKAAPGIGLFRQ